MTVRSHRVRLIRVAILFFMFAWGPPSSLAEDLKKQTNQVDAMIFSGAGAWGDEIESLENILTYHGATFQKVGSRELDGMSLDDLSRYKVLIFPGGNGNVQATSISSKAHERLRQVVQERGVGYVGFCAGAFIAVAPAPQAGQDVSYGLGIVDGPILDYYYLEDQGIDAAMTLESFADGSKADILWYGGPKTPQIPGGVIAKYPDGTAAMSEIWSGNGLVVLSGVHPTATYDTMYGLGVSPSDGEHLDIAWDLIHAAITRTPLPAFQ